MAFRLWRMAAGLALLGSIHSPLAGVQQSAAAATPAVQERAARLARLLNTEALIIGDAKSDEKAIAMSRELFGSNPDFVELEKDYPGIGVEIARALMPIVNRSARERFPQLWERQAALYARHFSAAELDDLIVFYGSPTGAKLLRMVGDIEPNHMLAEAKKSDDFSISGKSAIADIHAAAPQMSKQMNAEDEAALRQLVASGVAQKLRALGPQTQQVVIDWMNESAPWEDAETERVIGQIIDKRTGGQQ